MVSSHIWFCCSQWCCFGSTNNTVRPGAELQVKRSHQCMLSSPSLSCAIAFWQNNSWFMEEHAQTLYICCLPLRQTRTNIKHKRRLVPREKKQHFFHLVHCFPLPLSCGCYFFTVLCERADGLYPTNWFIKISPLDNCTETLKQRIQCEIFIIECVQIATCCSYKVCFSQIQF